jgi:hypothetical protein
VRAYGPKGGTDLIALEDVKNGAMVQGIAPNQPVEIVSVEWIGDQAISVVFRDLNSSIGETVLYRLDPGW